MPDGFDFSNLRLFTADGTPIGNLGDVKVTEAEDAQQRYTELFLRELFKPCSIDFDIHLIGLYADGKRHPRKRLLRRLCREKENRLWHFLIPAETRSLLIPDAMKPFIKPEEC